MSLKYLVLIICVGAVCAQESSMTLPPEIAEKISEDQMNEIKNKSAQALKELCEKNGGPDAYPKAENAFQEFTTCISELVDGNVLQEEIEKAKPNGQVDEVFKKYCDKTPDFKSCFLNLTESLHPCITAEERSNLKIVYNVTEQLAEFICYKDGDRIALFIAEHGPECMQEKQVGIQNCVNMTMGGNMTLDTNNLSSFSVNSIPKIRFGDKECGQMRQLQECVVHELETCSSTTSANIVEALFKFVRKATPCAEIADDEEIVAKKLNNAPQKESKSAASAASLAFKSITMSALVLSLLI